MFLQRTGIDFQMLGNQAFGCDHSSSPELERSSPPDLNCRHSVTAEPQIVRFGPRQLSSTPEGGCWRRFWQFSIAKYLADPRRGFAWLKSMERNKKLVAPPAKISRCRDRRAQTVRQKGAASPVPRAFLAASRQAAGSQVPTHGCNAAGKAAREALSIGPAAGIVTTAGILLAAHGAATLLPARRQTIRHFERSALSFDCKPLAKKVQREAGRAIPPPPWQARGRAPPTP